jgi:hypothetical protein
MKVLLQALICALLFCLLQSVNGQEIDILPEQLTTPLGSNNLLGVWHTTAEGTYLFASTHHGSTFSLTIIDCSDPQHPTLAGQTNLTGRPTQTLVAGQYAYAASQDAGVHILDVSDPTKPTRIATFNTSGIAYRVNLVGNLLYILDGTAIKILNVQSPATPKSVFELPLTGTVWDVAFNGDYAYVAARTQMHILSVTNLARPTLLKSIPMILADDVELKNDILYVSGEPGLITYDLSNPADPVKLGSYTVSGSGSVSVKLKDNLAFLSRRSGGLTVVDVTHPSSLLLAGQFLPQTGNSLETTGLALLQDHVLFTVGEDLNTLQVARILPALPKLGEVTLPFYNPPQVVLGQSHVLAGKYAFDVQDPTTPFITSSNQVIGRTIVISGTRAMMLSSSGFEIYEFNSSDQFELVGRTNVTFTFTSPLSLAFKDNLALVESGTSKGLYIFDVSNPATPVLRTNLGNAGIITDVSASGDIVAVVAENFAKRIPTLLDLSNPNSPAILQRISSIANADAILALDQRLYVADRSPALSIFDLAAPLEPKLLNQIRLRSSASKIILQDVYACVLETQNGYEIFDLKEVSNIRRVGGSSFPTTDFTTDTQHLYTVSSARFSVHDLFQEQPLTLDIPLLIGSGELQLHLHGPEALNVDIETSTDLSNWSKWQSATITANGTPITDQKDSGSRFYRLHKLQP